MPICAELKTHFVNLLRAQRAFTIAYAAALKPEISATKRPWQRWIAVIKAKQKFVEIKTNMLYIERKGDRKIIEAFLNSINEKIANKQIIELGELCILYGLSPFRGWYTNLDLVEKMREITDKREQKKDDLLKILNCKPEQISFTRDEALQGNIKYHYGDLDLISYSTVQELTLPEIINGELDLYKLESVEGRILPKYIVKGLRFMYLTSAENLTLPKYVGYNIALGGLKSTKGLVFPEDFEVGGEILFGETLPDSELENLKIRYPRLADKINRSVWL